VQWAHVSGLEGVVVLRVSYRVEPYIRTLIWTFPIRCSVTVPSVTAVPGPPPMPRMPFPDTLVDLVNNSIDLTSSGSYGGPFSPADRDAVLALWRHVSPGSHCVFAWSSRALPSFDLWLWPPPSIIHTMQRPLRLAMSLAGWATDSRAEVRSSPCPMCLVSSTSRTCLPRPSRVLSLPLCSSWSSITPLLALRTYEREWCGRSAARRGYYGYPTV